MLTTACCCPLNPLAGERRQSTTPGLLSASEKVLTPLDIYKMPILPTRWAVGDGTVPEVFKHAKVTDSAPAPRTRKRKHCPRRRRARDLDLDDSSADERLGVWPSKPLKKECKEHEDKPYTGEAGVRTPRRRRRPRRRTSSPSGSRRTRRPRPWLTARPRPSQHPLSSPPLRRLRLNRRRRRPRQARTPSTSATRTRALRPSLLPPPPHKQPVCVWPFNNNGGAPGSAPGSSRSSRSRLARCCRCSRPASASRLGASRRCRPC
jgi:hypothetical protein